LHWEIEKLYTTEAVSEFEGVDIEVSGEKRFGNLSGSVQGGPPQGTGDCFRTFSRERRVKVFPGISISCGKISPAISISALR
jgi:hypothetical protein